MQKYKFYFNKSNYIVFFIVFYKYFYLCNMLFVHKKYMREILFPLIGVFIILFSSCERGKPLSNEADILSVMILDEKGNLVAKSDNVISTDIVLITTNDVNLKKLKPIFQVSSGAKVYPDTKEYFDFTFPIEFIVVSEDKEWKQRYTISFSDLSWQFDFENWIPYGSIEAFNPKGWTSSNIATYTLNKMLSSNNKIEYAVYRTSDSYTGNYAVGITTREGGQLSIVPNIISGSLFNGEFNTDSLMSNPLKCPEFGIPFVYDGDNKPKMLKGYLKYTPGNIFINENGDVIPDKKDMFNFQAILFYGTKPLNVDNLNNDSRIIAKAYLEKSEQISEYTLFEVPFEYFQPIPLDKPLQLFISAASSKEGDYYRGAVGSTLIIDDIEIVFE